MMKEETLQERLKRLRMERGLSQRDLSTLAGFGSRCTLIRFESGNRIPNAGHLQSLADALGVSLTYLITGTDEPPEPLKPATPTMGNRFLIQGKPKERSAVQAYSRDSEIIRRMARQNGLTTPELVHQMLDYCLQNMGL